MFTNRSQQSCEGATAPVIERMEERVLLAASATLVDGEVIVAGTSGDDEVRFYMNRDGTKLKVDINDQTYAFAADDVESLRARLKGGDDFLKMWNVNGAVELELKAFGGYDNDTLIGGIMDDVLNGESGDDLIKGRDGLDQLLGEAGRDLLDGGIDVDVLIGGLGDDAEFDLNDVLADVDDADDLDGVIELDLEDVNDFWDDLRGDDSEDDEDGDFFDDINEFFSDLF